jgi:photosystem II stability/assembly factor-like uncharacterized protein
MSPSVRNRTPDGRPAEAPVHPARRRAVPSAWLAVGLLGLLCAVPAAAETVLIESGSSMTYLANTSDPGVDDTWFLPGFVEGPEWTPGVFGVGHDDNPAGPDALGLLETVIPGPVHSVYTRTTFELAAAADVHSLFFGADYDDGTVVWINGVEVYRSPEMRPWDLAWDTVSSHHESSNGTVPDYEPLHDISDLALPALQDGANVLAIGVWNNTGMSEDLVLVPRLLINRPLRRGPYLQQVTADGVLVRWRTATPEASRVVYGTNPGNPTSEVTLGGARTEHEVPLDGLVANTRYYYGIGTATEILAGADDEHFFFTPPPPGTPKPTRIWALGDTGAGNTQAMAVRDAYHDFTDDVAHGGAGARNTDLILMLGDNADPQGKQQHYQENIFEIYPRGLRQSVLFPTIGNHDLYDADSQTWPYYDIFTLPAQGEAGGVPSGTEEYYSYDYGNIHLVVLNSVEPVSNGFGGPMLAWLEADLQDVTEDWIIAYWHHPPYSKGSHDSDDPADSWGRLIWMRENAVPLLEDYGVDLVLSGHSHSYERSYLIDGHYGDSSTFTESMKKDPGDGNNDGGDGAYVKPHRGAVPYAGEGDGAVYTVAGCSSHLSPGKAQDLGGTEPNHPAMVVTLLELGSLVLDVNGNRLDLALLGDEGEILDRFTIFKGGPTVPPAAEFSAAPRAAAAPVDVSFQDLTAGEPTGWGWDVDGDGTIDSSEPSPTVQLDEPGLRGVRLEVGNSAGSDVEWKPDYLCVTAGFPGAIGGLRFDADPDVLFWDPCSSATAYDVVRGDLGALVGGGWSALDLACVEDDDPDVQATDPTLPVPGEALFYLAGAANCAGEQGSYEAPGGNAAIPRDGWVLHVCATCGTGTDDDGDDVCFPDDNCPDLFNPAQQDSDADGTGDACDGCPSDPDKVDPGQCGCGVPDTDTDGDATPDCNDGCPSDPDKVDPGQCGCGVADTDTDGDATPDCNDDCPSDPDKVDPGQCGCGVPDTDTDGDATPDCNDGCPSDPDKVDPGQCGCGVPDTDGDQDGTADCNDGCPSDPDKVDPGQCGCGVPDTDTDQDGTADCLDGCPEDPDKVDPGQCGCGVPDTDTDNDLTPDCLDGCPEDPFKVDPGQCGCGVPDVDTDQDGTANCNDGCPYDPNKIHPGVCGCGVPDVDSDSDGVLDCNDGCPSDPDKIDPGYCGCGVYECWAVMPSGTSSDLESVSFPLDALTGYAAGENGVILKTVDGGFHWMPLISKSPADLETIHFPEDAQTGYVVGDSGTILKTTDGGTNWVSLSPGTSAGLRGVFFVRETDTGWVVGDGGTILKTQDGGTTWVEQVSGTLQVLESVQFPSSTQTGYVVGRGGVILKTTDGGDTWVDLLAPVTKDLEAVLFPVDDMTGYVVGDDATLLKTTSGGFIWSEQNPSSYQTLRGISFPESDLTGWVVGSSGVIRKTVDGGATWVWDGNATTETLRDVDFPVVGTGFIVGSNGTILRWVEE